MGFSVETRQKILHRIGKVHEAYVHLGREYPMPFSLRFHMLPDDLLPYPKEVIREVFEAELSDPEFGAKLRGLTVERWRDTLGALRVDLAWHYLPRAEWVARQEELEPAMEQGVKWLVERDVDAL
jgi:hypothetical protein